MMGTEMNVRDHPNTQLAGDVVPLGNILNYIKAKEATQSQSAAPYYQGLQKDPKVLRIIPSGK